MVLMRTLGRRLRIYRRTSAEQIFDRQLQERQGFVDGGPFGVVAWIEPDAALAPAQQQQTAPEGAIQQRVAPVGARDVERQHHA